MSKILLICAVLVASCSGASIIPQPLYSIEATNVFGVVQDLQVVHNYPHCNVLNDALKQVHQYIFKSIYKKYEGKISGTIKTLTIGIKSSCIDYPGSSIWPSDTMDESYQMSVTNTSVSILSQEVWGILRALATLFQMVYRNDVGTLLINEQIIYDKPRFSYRGLMLDTSRHFIPVKIVLENLELMYLSKLNVFHWHIVDDQSFPYQSYSYPDLSNKGAFHPFTNVYTQEDVSLILEFARLRGIRVIPEFDSPGHSLSWGKGQQGLLTPCYSSSKPNGKFGPIDPTVNSTYKFLTLLFREISLVFPDSYLHLGGDEVDFNCWKSNPKIVEFTKKMGFPNNFARLQGYYMNLLLKIVANVTGQSSAKKTMVWQEVFDNNNEVSKDTTIIHVWKGEDAWQDEMVKVTSKGYNTVLSSCWYLNYISYGMDWKKPYECDPQNFKGGDPNNVIGGEACMWGEYVDETNVIQRTWPRATIVAERLWSERNVTDETSLTNRANEFRCRMLINGHQAETIAGPGTFCNRPGLIH